MAIQDIDLKYKGGALNTSRNVSLGGTLSVTGAVSLASTLTVSGPVIGSSIPGSTAPADLGFVSWSYDPVLTSSTTTTVVNTIYLTAVYVRYAATVTKLWTVVNAAGTTSTAGQNNLGLYDSTGTLLASVNVDSLVTSNGPKSGTITATAVSPGLYWVAQQYAASVQPGIGRGNAAILSTLTINQTAATYRFATNGSGTSLPASIAPSNNSTTGSAALWAGIS
ncbi:hypothetical protein PV350_23460 [Streptomyces sp. PA03-6a]|nr:hypothetical protein [Streptomyces sp. PA03-6a]